MHVHLSYARISALPALIANGVTYVRDVGSRLAEIDEWRGEIAAGRLALANDRAGNGCTTDTSSPTLAGCSLCWVGRWG